MKLYGLVADGLLQDFNDRSKILCKKLFRSREEAESHIASFKLACTTRLNEYDLRALKDDEYLKMNIVELELDE